MSYVINGCYNPYLAEILMLGSIFKHLLKKSRKFLLLHFILDFRFVIFGVNTRQKPVFYFCFISSIAISSYTYSYKISYFVKYFETYFPFSIIHEGQGPLKP